MAELAAVASIAGVLSLGLQLCNGLFAYFSSYRGSDNTVRAMLDAANELESTLRLIEDRQSRIVEIQDDTRQRINGCLTTCRDKLIHFQAKINKVKSGSVNTSTVGTIQQTRQLRWEGKLDKVLQRGLYPFRESSIVKLKELCNDCSDQLHIVLELLNIDLNVSTFSKVDGLNLQLVNVTDGIRNIQVAIQQTADGISAVSQHQKSQTVLKAIEWLSPLQGIFEGRQHQHFNVKGRQDRSGQHFIETDSFQRWTAEPGQVLWCNGAPGIGKTVTTSYIINHLQNSTVTRDIGIAYIYCSYTDTVMENAVNMLSTIVQQLLQQQPADVIGIVDLFEKHMKMKTRPTLLEIQNLLPVVVRAFTKTYIIVDALDECSDAGEERESFLTGLTNLLPSINLLLVSRPLPHLESQLANVVHYELQAHSEDIIQYAKARIAISSKMQGHMQKDRKIFETIIVKVLERSKGMFLMARLYLDHLLSLSTLRTIKESLNNLPDKLFGVYNTCLDRIRSQSSEDAALAISTLHWIVHAVRPLTLIEMQSALAIRPGDTLLDKDGEPDGELLISVCAGIVVIEKTTNTLTLVHYTAQEFFWSNPGQLLKECHLNLAQTCITHLLFDEFEPGPETNDIGLEQKLANFPLLRYAVQYWSRHMQCCTNIVTSETMGTILSLLLQQSRVDMIYQISEIPNIKLSGYSQTFTKGANGLCLAASLGLVDIVSAMLNARSDNSFLTARDENGKNALHHTIQGSSTTSNTSNTTSTMLRNLDSGMEQNDAASRITNLLLAAGVNPTTSDCHGRTPLHYAAANDQTAVISALIKYGASSSLRATDGYNGTPLYRAVEAGQITATQMLLDLQSEVFIQNSFNQTLLHRAAEENHLDLVRMLIDHVRATKGEAELRRWVLLKDYYGWTAMYRAADHGHTEIAKLLSMAAKPTKSSVGIH